MREQEVTLSLEKFFKKMGCEILSLNNPFSGKSVWIKPKGGYRGKGALIPDIIARVDKTYFLVESYEKLKIKDIEKLEKYDLPEYKESIKETFDEKREINLIKVMAYPEPIKEFKYPKDFLIVGVKEDLSINLYIGKDLFVEDKKELFNKFVVSGKNIFL